MNKIGRKIYFDKSTGNIILDKGEMMGSVIETSIEQDTETFVVLSERNRETFDVIELLFGQFAQDFAECNGYRVNVEFLATLTEDKRHEALVFSYPDSENPDAPPVFQKALSEQVRELRNYTQQLNDDLLALSDFVIETSGGM